MSELRWKTADELPGLLAAEGPAPEHWTYLIETSEGGLLARLTRYRTEYSGPGRYGRELDAARVAAQAGRYVIELGAPGNQDMAPDAVVQYAKDMAAAHAAGVPGRTFHGGWPRVDLPPAAHRGQEASHE
jgi:hypothetical protein